MTSKCSTIKRNHEPKASSFIAKFLTLMVGKSTDHDNYFRFVFLQFYWEFLTSISVEVSRKIAGKKKGNEIAQLSLHFHGRYSYQPFSEKPLSYCNLNLNYYLQTARK